MASPPASSDPESNLSSSPVFYTWPQLTAQSIFPALLCPYLPHSNPIYNRLLAPHNTPSRHCVFAATFPAPPSASAPAASPPALFTLVFADRSRHDESQIWLFNPLIAAPTPLAPPQQAALRAHCAALLHFFRNEHVLQAPGWPFDSVVRIACVHELLAAELEHVAGAGALLRNTRWRAWNIPLRGEAAKQVKLPPLPEGFSFVRPVPEVALSVVLATSSIKRQPETLMKLPSVGVYNARGEVVAWAYLGVDGSLATLYVLPEYRGRGLANAVAGELVAKVATGEEAVEIESEEDGAGTASPLRAYDGASGWLHADVYEGNLGSEAVMRRLGATRAWEARYMFIDTAIVP